jgi:hypothetical protein
VTGRWRGRFCAYDFLLRLHVCVLWNDNLIGVHEGSTRLSSRVIASHFQSRGFGEAKGLK